MHLRLSRRGFFKAGAALAMAGNAGIEVGASQPTARSAAPPNNAPVEHAPFHKPADIPPIKFMRDTIPQAAIVSVRGESTEALVPDTCNLEERARLFVDNYLNSITVPELMNEPFDRGDFDLTPQRINLDTGTYSCALPKFRESLPLLRIMTGSKKGLDIDQSWAENILKCIGPDGLYYVPRIGRPWDKFDIYPYWPQGKKVEFFAPLPLCNGRLLGSLAIYYKNTGDEVWNRTARGVVDGLSKQAVPVDDWAFFPNVTPVYGDPPLTREQIQKAIAEATGSIGNWGSINSVWGGVQGAELKPAPSIGEWDSINTVWQTWIVTGLTQYYRVSGYEPAKQLAYRLVKDIRRTKFIERWPSQFHDESLAMQCMLELALVAQDEELAEYARRQYDFAKSGEKMIALPQIGFFANDQGHAAMEGCNIGDMTAIAVKLTQLNMGDQYWDDVDRYVRNSLTAIQWTHAGYAEAKFMKLWEMGKTRKVPLEYHQLADHLPQRLVGSFSVFSMPNDIGGSSAFNTCCSGNCSRALYYAWESILKYDKNRQELKVNLLLNRTSPWADVNSHIPYIGRVEIQAKQPLTSLKVRAPNWVDKQQVVCRVGAQPRRIAWNGNYLEAGSVQPGQIAMLEFPIQERREKLESFDHKYEAVFRGNDCVELTPGGQYYTLFQRDHYHLNQPHFVKVRRFACENTIEY